MNGTGFLILFCLICVLFPCEGQVKPPSNGTNLTFFPGSTVKIDWSYVGNISQTAQFRTWFFRSTDSSPRRQLAAIAFDQDFVQKDFSVIPRFDIERPAALVLKNVDKTYNGIYIFSLTTQSSNIPQTSEIVVYIAAKPNVTFSCPIHNEINEGDNFTCVCRGEGGNPPADVTWFKDGVQIAGTEKENITLTRNHVTETDSGSYKCKAESYPNKAFKHEKSIELKVRLNSPPNNTKITFEPNPATVGDRVEIKCYSEAVPEPSFIIMRNGINVSTEKTFNISQVQQNDEGLYTCIAENVLGNDSATDNLTVVGQITPTRTISTPATRYAATSSITSKRSEPTPTTPPTSASTSASTSSSPGLPTGAIIGISIGVLVLIIIIVVVVYCCKSKEKERSSNSGNIDPVPGNSHELEEPGPSDGAYDTVWPVETSGSKSKPPVENTLPPVYAAVDKNNREGNTLYASLDNKALKSSRASKKEPDRPQQTEYASIDFAKTGNAPKAV